MNTIHKTVGSIGTGLAVIAIGIAASGRPAAAQAPLLAQPNHVMDWFSGHQNNDRDHDQRRAEQERREQERARHEAEERRAQWRRGHRHDRDFDQRRNDRDHNWNYNNR